MSAASPSAASTAERVSVFIKYGQWDLARELIPTAVTKSAPLYLLEAQAFHARAFFGNDQDRDGDMQRACEGAQAVINMASTASADQALLAQALLVRANTLANLASRVKEFKGSLGEATSAVQQAESVLKELAEPDVANAYRIRGVINQAWHHLRPDDKWLRQVQKNFLAAIREYERHGKEESSKWCAVSHWNMYIILQSLNREKAAVSFLKRAVDLREKAQGYEHPYTRSYRRQLRSLEVCMGDAEMKQIVQNELHKYDRYFGPGF
ncbi:unnamed protein product [Symbiodinium sp. CCMP2592]|nr:unnamed protein product [Symbiodinium sp. CCMP2592]